MPRFQDPSLDRLLAAVEAGVVGLSSMSSDPRLLTEERLRELTGFDDLQFVTEAELEVDDSTGTVDLLGSALPSVTDLRLNNSRVSTFRVFGTRLTRLKRLWLSRSGVRDLSGVQFMHQISELYLAFNSIDRLGPLAALLNLEVIDLEGNRIESVREIEDGLGALTELKWVTLAGNPFATKSATYRADVFAALGGSSSTLEMLDDRPAANRHEAGDALPPAGEGRDLARVEDELAVLHDALRVSSAGLEQLVEDHNRGLYSRQTSSALGWRRAATAGARGSSAGGAGARGEVLSAAGSSSLLAGGVGAAARGVPTEGIIAHRGLNSAPAHLGSPTKGAGPSKASSTALPSPPPARPQKLSGAPTVFSGSITRTLRQTKSVVKGGAVLRQLDSGASVGTPSGGGAPRTGSSASAVSTPPCDMVGYGDDDMYDDTEEANERRRAERALDAFINEALSKLPDSVNPGGYDHEDVACDDDGAMAASSATGPESSAATADEDRPEIAAWKKRMADHLQATQAAPAAVAAPLTQADVLHAVLSYRTGTAKAYQEDLMREATGADGKTDNYEAIDMTYRGGGGSDDDDDDTL